MRELSSTRRGSVFLPMPLDPPLVLTHDHDPNIVFRGQSLVQHPQNPLSYDDLRSKSHHLSLVYHDLLSRHRILADAHQALKAEHSVLRSSYASLASKHQEYGDDAINSRIQSWRYVVRVEELEKELRLLRQGNAHSITNKRKYADLGGDAAESQWSASSRSHSASLTNNTSNTPASSKTAHSLGIQVGRDANNDVISSGIQAATGPPHNSTSTDIRAPKRHKECDYERVSADVHQSLIVTPVENPIRRQEDTTLETYSRPMYLTRQCPTQTRPKTRLPQRRWPDIVDHSATAAAIAAAFSGSAVSQPDRSSSPSPATRGTLTSPWVVV